MTDVLDELRRACATVAGRARFVSIDTAAIDAYAARLPPDQAPAAPEPDNPSAAFWLTLDAINFGSGWFPTLRKRDGQSGYYTIATGLRERFERHGPWSPSELAAMRAGTIADVLGQDPGHELMGLFAWSLRDLGRRVGDEYGGSFEAVVGASAANLVQRLAGWDCFADTSVYAGIQLPFLKRAQIAAADLDRAKVTRFGDLERLTMFADNLVPHVLRLDGILRFDPGLVARIEREELLEHGSAEEVEIRACALHAVDLITAARPGSRAADLDQLLWLRGQQRAYKERPRHRCRCTAY